MTGRRRRVTFRIGLPDESGPRIQGVLPFGGTRVVVADPRMGPSGTRASVVPVPPTKDGFEWAVAWKGPNMTGTAVRYCPTLKEARRIARNLRMNGPG